MMARSCNKDVDVDIGYWYQIDILWLWLWLVDLISMSLSMVSSFDDMRLLKAWTLRICNHFQMQIQIWICAYLGGKLDALALITHYTPLPKVEVASVQIECPLQGQQGLRFLCPFHNLPLPCIPHSRDTGQSPLTALLLYSPCTVKHHFCTRNHPSPHTCFVIKIRQQL